MSKGLEALKHLYLRSSDYTNAICVMDYEIIKKELTVLEIIISKNVQIILLKNTKDFETYNKMLGATFNKKDIKKMSLTQEVYDLLKEVLL